MNPSARSVDLDQRLPIRGLAKSARALPDSPGSTFRWWWSMPWMAKKR